MKYLYILILFLILFSLGIPLYMVLSSFIRPKGGYKSNSIMWKEYDEVNKIGREFVQFFNPEEVFIKSFDGLKLRAVLQINDKTSNNFVICVHGFQSSGGLYDHGMTAKYFNSKKINALYVDDRAHGKSEGSKIGFSVLDYKDILSWIEYLNNRFKDINIILYGISMGAATVLNVSGEPNLNKSVKGVIADCPFSSGFDQIAYLNKSKYHLPSYLLFFDNLFMKIICGYSLKEAEPKLRVKNSNVPILLIHGDEDRFVPTYMSKEIYENAKYDKELIIIKGARHAKSYLVNKQLYEESLDKFLFKVLNNGTPKSVGV